MARPVPYSLYMTNLALSVQSQFRSGLPGASLLAATPSSAYALLVEMKNSHLYVLDRSAGRVLHPLELPPKARQASDFVGFIYSPSGNRVGAYNPRDSSFAFWSLDEGKLLSAIDGAGEFHGKLIFLDEDTVALADSHRISTRNVNGKELWGTRLPEETRDILLFTITGPTPILIAVAVVQRKNLGAHIHAFKVIKGVIEARSEGPYRERAQNPRESKSFRLCELYNIPGSTDRSLIVCDEECLVKEPDEMDGIPEFTYTTRLVAMDPLKAVFYEGEMKVPGRHCLEIQGEELRLIDEVGRHRRVQCFPLRLENADWRLEGAGLEPSW